MAISKSLAAHLEPITWTHHRATGTGRVADTRTGRWWSDAPTPATGYRAATWVIPDDPYRGDPYTAILVAAVSARGATRCPCGLPQEPGELVSCNGQNTGFGLAMQEAERVASWERFRNRPAA